MSIRFESQAEECIGRLQENVPLALEAAGQSAVRSVRRQMLTGYARPILDTGALLNSIVCTVEGTTLHVGTSLPYAEAVHDGTARTPGRPFLQDGMQLGAEGMMDALSRVLSEKIP